MTIETLSSSSMSNIGCAGCRLRFTRAQTAHLGSCPRCAWPMAQSANAEQTVGFRLYTPEPVNDPLQTAVAISVTVPDPRGCRP